MSTVSSTDPLSNPDHASEHASLNLLAETLGELLQGTSGLLNLEFSSFADGAVTSPKLSTEIVNRLVPAGMISGWPITSAIPSGWAAMGTTLSNAQTLYPDLWSVAPTGWRSGSDLVLPNPDGRLLRGLSNQTPGTTGGTGDMSIPLSYGVPITANNVDVHTHGTEHTHATNNFTNNTSTGGKHTHGLNGGNHTHTYYGRNTAVNTNVGNNYPGNIFAGYRFNSTSAVTNNVPTMGSTNYGNAVFNYGNSVTNTTGTTQWDPANIYTSNVSSSSTEYIYYSGGLARMWNYLIIKVH